jgi:hypothetical protein
MIDDVVLQKLVNNAQSAQMKMGYSDDQPGLYIEQNKMAGLNRMPLQLSKKKEGSKEEHAADQERCWRRAKASFSFRQAARH